MRWIVRLSAALAAAVIAVLVPVGAQACTPIPPPPLHPGESKADYDTRVTAWNAARAKEDADFRDKNVRGFWDNSTLVVLARVTSSTPTAASGFRLRLTGVTWLKGRKTSRGFDITTPPPLPCGPIDIAAKGDLVVLYVPTKASGLGDPFWIRPTMIRDPRVTVLLPADTK